MGPIKLKRISIRGIGVPDTSSGYLCDGDGYEIYSHTSSEAQIYLRLELPQRDSFIVMPKMEGIRFERIAGNGRKASLVLSGLKVDEAIRQITHAANSAEVVKILAPFAAIANQLRIDAARDNSPATPERAANPSMIVLTDVVIQGVARFTDPRSMRVYGRKYRFDGVEFQVTNGPAAIRTKVKVPRGHRIIVSEPCRARRKGEAYIDVWPEHFGRWQVSLEISKSRLQAPFDEHVRHASSPREVWEASKPFRDFLVNNCRIVKA